MSICFHGFSGRSIHGAGCLLDLRALWVQFPAAVLQALANGTQPATLPPRTPDTISWWRASVVLAQMGLTAQVTTMVAALPSPQKEIAQAAIAGCSDVSRTSGIVALLTKQLNWTPAQLDNFFATAYALPA